MLKNKKTLLVLLVILLLFILQSMVNAATTNATETTSTSTGAKVNWSYELDGNNAKELKCTNISSITGNLTIPSTIDGHTVTTIGYEAFSSCSGLTSVTIPNGVTEIGEYAFDGCSGLRSVTIPNGVTTIGYAAFRSCSGLMNITIPDSVTTIEKYAFADCSGLKTIKLSNNLTKLSNDVFYNCRGITEISLPENLTTIDSNALSCCYGLKFLKIPENVVSISQIAFGYSSEKPNNLTIFGKEGSTAETYAKNNKINFEKIENWDKRNEITGSDVSAPTVSSMYIDKLTGCYDSTTEDYRVPRNVQISIIVKFSEQIKGTQIPTLTIKCGEGSNIELKNGVISGDKIVYTYKIKENDEGLITAVKLEGGDVSDSSGNKAVLSVKELKAYLGSNYVYAKGSAVGSNTSTNTNNQDKNTGASTQNKTDTQGTTTKKDTTTATVKLPNTGKVLLVWIIGIVAVSAIVAHIRYKRLYM